MAAPDGLSMSLDDMIRKSTKVLPQPGGTHIGGGGMAVRSGGGFGHSGGGFSHVGHNGSMRRMSGPHSSGISKPGRSAFNQGRRQPHPQHGGRSGGRGGGRGQARSERDFWLLRRKEQMCFIEEATGDVVVQYHKTIIVRISPEGDILLDSGGFHRAMTLASFNDVLEAVGVKVSAPEPGRLENSQWLVSDGRSLFRFQDGMTLGSKGPHSATRGPLVLQAFQNPSAAAATYASNAAAAQVGLLPKNAPGVPLPGSTRGSSQNRSAHQVASRFREAQYVSNSSPTGRGRNQPRFGGRGRGITSNNSREVQSAGQEWHTDMGGPPDVDMSSMQDVTSYQKEPFQQSQAGGYRSSGLERYDLGGMRSQGWDAEDDVIVSRQQRRLYAQGRHL